MEREKVLRGGIVSLDVAKGSIGLLWLLEGVSLLLRPKRLTSGVVLKMRWKGKLHCKHCVLAWRSLIKPSWKGRICFLALLA